MRPILTACAICALTALPAAAQGLLTASDVEEIANLARGYGAATVTTDTVGDPMITGRIDGMRYAVLFYGCTAGANCRDIVFAASWGPDTGATLEAINQWNAETRFGKAYLDDDQSPAIEMTVNLFGGVSPANLDDTIEWWAMVLKQFRDEVIEP